MHRTQHQAQTLGRTLCDLGHDPWPAAHLPPRQTTAELLWRVLGGGDSLVSESQSVGPVLTVHAGLPRGADPEQGARLLACSLGEGIRGRSLRLAVPPGREDSAGKKGN